MSILRENGLAALQTIRRAGKITRNDLAQQLGISLSLATKVTAGLIEQNLICEAGRSEPEAGGRPANYLSLAAEAGYAVGIQFDVERQITVLTDLCGTPVAMLDEKPGPLPDRETVIACIEDIVQRVITRARIPAERVFGVGVALLRTVDPVTGITHGWHNVSGWETLWESFSFIDGLRQKLPYPHLVADDVVRALGVAEANYGQGNTAEDFLYLLVDSGIGMAIMLGGQPYIGFSHIAGEIGHIPVQGRNEVCECGNIGCLQQLASANAIIARLKQRIQETPVQSSLRLNGSSENEVSIEDVIRAGANGDKLAFPLLIDAGEDLGKALATVVNLFGPRYIITGGALASSDIFLDAARRELKLRALQKASQVVELHRSHLDHSAGAWGAATMVLNELFAPKEKNLIDLYGIE